MLVGSMVTMRNKEALQEKINSSGIIETSIDDYLEFAPIVTGGAMHLFGAKGRHDPLNGLICLLKAEAGMAALVYPMKYAFGVMRPDSSQATSLPSGHAAQAFVAATWLHYEFGKGRWWLSALAYGSAATVAALRVRQNKHWVQDVLLGGAIGMFSTVVAFETHRYRWKPNHGTPHTAHRKRTTDYGIRVSPVIGPYSGVWIGMRF